METNYKKYSKQNETEEVVTETAEVKQVLGVVFNCEKLNVRKEPNKDAVVLSTLNTGTEVLINDANEDFYSVVTESGIEGYCMKQYVKVKE